LSLLSLLSLESLRSLSPPLAREDFEECCAYCLPHEILDLERVPTEATSLDPNVYSVI